MANIQSKNVTITTVGRAAREYIESGLEVNHECYAEEGIRSCDGEVLKLVRKHGVVALLEAIHDAAVGAAEVHEDTDEVEDTTPFRLHVFGRKLDAAIKTLR